MQSVASCTPTPHGVTRPLAFARSLPLEPVAPKLCSTCRLRTLCLPGNLPASELKPIDELVSTRRRVQRDDHLFRAGDPFRALYAFRSGFFKSYVVTSDGRTQVTGFPMAGDLAGMDAMGSDTHTESLVALDTGEVCILPYARLQEQASRHPALQRQISRIMSRELVREQRMMTLLGTMSAEAKVADFLLSLSHRFAARGYSSTEFNLRMRRADIGSYLGLKLETVSRALSKLRRIGVIRTDVRHVAITNREKLRTMTLD
jgi:CRP/FNR family transcriptional regulator